MNKTLTMKEIVPPSTNVVGGASEELKHLKEALREQEALAHRYRQALEDAMDAVVQIDGNQCITLFNGEAEKVFGFDRHEVMGRDVSSIIPTEHRAMFSDAERGEGIVREAIRKDGRRFGINIKVSKFQTAGDPHLTAFIKDVSQEQVADQAFQNMQRELKTRMDQIDLACVVSEADLKGNITFVNDKLCEVTGYTREECIGKPHSLFRHPDMPKSVFKEMWATIGRGRIFRGVVKNRCKDGSPYWVDALIAPVLGSDGKPVKYIGVRYVITDQVLREEELKVQAEKQGSVIEVVKAMATGDLTRRTDCDLDVAREVNRALDNFSTLLTQISKGADVVTSSANLLQKKTDDMKRSSSEVSAAIAQIAKGAQDQAQRTDESSKLVNHVKTSALDMERKSNVITNAAERGLARSNQGMEIVKVLVNNMKDINDTAGQTSTSINELTARTEEIGRALDVITDIAGQTNLLALNAAIEAARAGDAGRGFAVVAEEIRKLADDSRKSAVEIEKIVSDVQQDTRKASNAIEKMQSSVGEGGQSSREVEHIFQEIAASSEETFSVSKEIQGATTVQRDAISNVVKNIEQIVVVSEETAAGTQEVASSSQQVNDGMLEISNAGDELSAVAAELQAGVLQFKLIQ